MLSHLRAAHLAELGAQQAILELMRVGFTLYDAKMAILHHLTHHIMHEVKVNELMDPETPEADRYWDRCFGVNGLFKHLREEASDGE